MESSTLDVEMGSGDVYQATVKSGEKSRSWPWKMVGAVVFVAFCVVASVLFACNVINRTERESTTALQSSSNTGHHRHMLSQIAKKTAAIHLSVSGQDDEKEPLHWRKDVDQSFSTGDLKLENNELVIPSDGLYFVYSQASFEVHCKSDDSRNTLSYTIQWASLSFGSKKDLLSGVKSICHANSEEEQKNQDQVQEVIYLGAIFQLYKGDKLSTQTSHLSEIQSESSKTFFGVFQL